MPNITEITCKQALNKINNPGLPQSWDLNLYRGCQHGCVYCYAMYTHDYLEGDFFNDIYVKTNIAEQLDRQLSHPTWKKETIAIAGVTDCYQPIEAKYKLMPDILKVLIKHQNPVNISTKSNLILRDFDLIEELATVTQVEVNASIVTMDDELRRKIEPVGRNGQEKFDMLKAFKHTNVTTGLLQMPIIPYLTDSRENIDALYASAKQAGVKYVVPGVLYLRGKTRPHFFDFIKKEFPDLFIPLTKLYQKGGRNDYKDQLYAMIKQLRKKHQLDSWYALPKKIEPDLATVKQVASGFEQLSLFDATSKTEAKIYTSAAIPSPSQKNHTQNRAQQSKKSSEPINLNPFIEVTMGETQTPPQQSHPIQLAETTTLDPIRGKFYEMRTIGRDKNRHGVHDEIFYLQGKFMENFKDDYEEATTFLAYFPTYQMMGYEQLRTYFTWRTKVRTGEVPQISPSYAFLYIYELLNQIGTKNPTDGLEKITTFWQKYRQLDDTLNPYIINWLKDYHVYYLLKQPFETFVQQHELTSYYPEVFCYCSNEENSLDLFNNISTYNIKKSKFYTDEYAPMIRGCFYFILSKIREAFNQKGHCFEDLIFQPLTRESVWIPFYKALFHSNFSQSEREVILSKRERYSITTSRITYQNAMLTANGKQLLGYLLKEMESQLRTVVKFKYKLKANVENCDSGTLAKLESVGIVLPDLIKQLTETFYLRMNHREVSVDMKNLGRIRRDAYETQEKLIVLEEVVEKVVVPKKEVEKIKKPEMPGTPWGLLKSLLTAVELEALGEICRGHDIRGFAKSRGVMLEVLIEGINEKAMDSVGDTLLELEDDVMLYEDYVQEVKELVGNDII